VINPVNKATSRDELLVAETQNVPRLEMPTEEAVDDRNMSEENEIDNINEQMNDNDLIDEIDIIDGTKNSEHRGENDQNVEQLGGINLEVKMDMHYGPCSLNYNLRPHRPHDYSNLYATMDHICQASTV
jgi:hypothetical protein